MSRFFTEKLSSLEAYVPGEQPRDRKYIKLNTNESPFPPSPLAQRLARQVAGDLQLYSDPQCRDLTAVACEKFGISSDEIVFTNGSDEVLNYIFMAFCDANHPVVFPDITYGFYPVFAALNSVPFYTIPLAEDFSLNVEDYIGVGKTIVIANPNAPTGMSLPLSKIEQLVAGNPDNIVVIDEAYVDFGAESAISLIHRYNNLIVTQTFSKSRSLAGGRLGMGFACRDIISDITKVRYSSNPYNVNSMTMAAGMGALLDEEYFHDCCNTIINTREDTMEKLRALGFTVLDSSSNFLFAKHNTMPGKDVFLELRKRGILVRHFDKERIRDYNRITIGSQEEMDAVIAALKEILG